MVKHTQTIRRQFADKKFHDIKSLAKIINEFLNLSFNQQSSAELSKIVRRHQNLNLNGGLKVSKNSHNRGRSRGQFRNFQC